jgi:putative protein kinase ArgK-like GTPase of G3E family
MLDNNASPLRHGADDLTQDIEPWQTPICKTVARPTGVGDGIGIAELVSQLDAHQAYLRSNGALRAKERARAQASLEGLLREALFARFLSGLEAGVIEDTISRIASRQTSPYEALDQLLSGPSS